MIETTVSISESQSNHYCGGLSMDYTRTSDISGKYEKTNKSNYKFVYDVEVTNASENLKISIQSFIETLLLYKNNSMTDLKTLENANDCIMAQLLCMIYCLNSGNPTKTYVEECERIILNKNCNHREKLLLQAVKAWNIGNIDESIQFHTQIAKEYPNDILSLFLCFNHYVYVHNTDRLVNLLKIVEPHLKDDPFFLGMYCFALTEAYEFEEAYHVGMKGYHTYKQSSWVHHSLSHVFQAMGKLDEGIEFMERNSIYWEDCSPFMYSHNWWHVAMLYIAKCKGPDDPLLRKVEQIIDSYTWYTDPETEKKKQFNSDITVISGIIGLLWVLDLNGYSSKHSIISQEFFQKKWASIIPFVQEKISTHVYPFFDIHFVYALARVNDLNQVQKFVSSIEEYGKQWKKQHLIESWKIILPAASKGVVSFLLGDYPSAFNHLNPIHQKLELLGGSNPQRAPMDETYIRSCIYHGKYMEGLAYLTPNENAIRNGGVCQFPRCLQVLTYLMEQSKYQD